LSFNERSEAARRRVLGGTGFWAWQWKTLPLAAFAGLRVRSLDESSCTVALPGGWRTQNPFRSTYFAAQAMAAEMSTGAPAMILLAGSAVSVAMLVTGFSAAYKKKIVGESLFTFPDVADMRAAIAEAEGRDEPRVYVARTTGRDAVGDVVSEFEVSWSFRRRARK
jgi:hypothetical protein